MVFALEKIVLWGRSFDEYRRMFALTEADLGRRILGCADGPASFNAELTASGCSVVSCDPIYAFSAREIRRQINATYRQIIEQARHNADSFVWSEQLPDPEALGRHRLTTMDRFLEDYETGRHAGRYVVGELPELPFEEGAFDIAVCSHFLFLYSEHLSEQLHVDSIRNLAEIAGEVRVFPLIELGAKPSRHVEPVAAALQSDGYRVTFDKVNYEFQRGGYWQMRVSR